MQGSFELPVPTFPLPDAPVPSIVVAPYISSYQEGLRPAEVDQIFPPNEGVDDLTQWAQRSSPTIPPRLTSMDDLGGGFSPEEEAEFFGHNSVTEELPYNSSLVDTLDMGAMTTEQADIAGAAIVAPDDSPLLRAGGPLQAAGG